MALDSSFEGMPKHFAEDGDLIQSHMIVAMSASFPDGEDFFVKSVRHYRDQISDPVLKRQVAGFIGQEAMHGREHRMMNEFLDRLGYPAKRMERFSKRGNAFQLKHFSPMSNLAQTAAIEHLTATLAETILTDEAYRKSYGAAEQIFAWHALEESEHKAVAFDVYRAIGGSEKLRVRTMKLLRWSLVLLGPIQLMILLLGDRATFRRGNLRRSWRKFRSSALIQRSTWERLKDYERPDFHPNDWDNTALVEEWQNKLFGQDGELNKWLVGSAA